MQTSEASAETVRPHESIGTVYGAALNDRATIERMATSFEAAPYRAAPKAPVLYIKPRNTFATDGCAVAVPAVPGEVRIDATVGAVIGRTATRVAAVDALDHVRAYVVVSDVTLPHASFYRPAVRQRCRDGFCPIGAEWSPPGFDVSTAEITVSIDGAPVHHRRLDRLVRDLPTLLAEITAFMTLEVGDVLLLGPPDDGPLARPGATVRIDVPGLGSLSHTVVVEPQVVA